MVRPKPSKKPKGANNCGSRRRSIRLNTEEPKKKSFKPKGNAATLNTKQKAPQGGKKCKPSAVVVAKFVQCKKQGVKVAVGRNHSKMRGSDDENITEEEDDGSPMSSSLADKKRRARKKKPDVPLSDTSSSSDNVVDSSYCEGDSSCSDSSVNEGKSSLPRVFGEKLNALLHQYNDSLKINHYRLVQRQYEFAQLYRKLKLFIRSKISKLCMQSRRNRVSWDYMFQRWLGHAKKFPLRKNRVSGRSDPKLANWVKEQRRHFTNDNMKMDRFNKLIENGFDFHPRKKKGISVDTSSYTNHEDSKDEVNDDSDSASDSDVETANVTVNNEVANNDVVLDDTIMSNPLPKDGTIARTVVHIGGKGFFLHQLIMQFLLVILNLFIFLCQFSCRQCPR